MIATFQKYYDWLRSLGAGGREEYPETRTWWAEDYRELLAPDEVKPYTISLARKNNEGLCNNPRKAVEQRPSENTWREF